MGPFSMDMMNRSASTPRMVSAGIGGSFPTLTQLNMRPQAGMLGSGPNSYMTGAGRQHAWMQDIGAVARPQQQVSDIRRHDLSRMGGAGVRPGTPPPMSAVAQARMGGQQGAMMGNPNDPRNAVMGGYR